jgi:hypothetical protein
MSYFESLERDRIHRQKLSRKIQRIDGLRALLEEWEAFPELDYQYVLRLRQRLRSAENQLEAMKP